jgi:hypothetical protein
MQPLDLQKDGALESWRRARFGARWRPRVRAFPAGSSLERQLTLTRRCAATSKSTESRDSERIGSRARTNSSHLSEARNGRDSFATSGPLPFPQCHRSPNYLRHGIARSGANTYPTFRQKII